MVDKPAGEPASESQSPKLEVTGPWFIFSGVSELPAVCLRRVVSTAKRVVPSAVSRLRPPLFWVVAMLFIAAGGLFIGFSNGRDYPADPRFYGQWDVFVGPSDSAKHCDTWTLSPPRFFNGILRYERSKGGVNWGVKHATFYEGVGRKWGPYAYDIVEVTNNRILLIGARKQERVELRRRQ